MTHLETGGKRKRETMNYKIKNKAKKEQNDKNMTFRPAQALLLLIPKEKKLECQNNKGYNYALLMFGFKQKKHNYSRL